MHDHVDAMGGMLVTGPGPVDQAVGPEAPAAIAEGGGDGPVDGQGATVAVVEGDQEVVAQAVVFREQHRSSLAGRGGNSAPDTAVRRRAAGPGPYPPTASTMTGTAAPGSGSSPGRSSQRMRGSRRNQRSWRRANWRVRTTARSTASSSGPAPAR